MYTLVARIPDGLGQLKNLLENHITSRGMEAIEKLGAEAINVSTGPIRYFKHESFAFPPFIFVFVKSVVRK